VEEKPDVTYSDVGGCKEQIEKLREVVEVPLLHVRQCLVGSRPSDHYFRSVCWFVCLSVCLCRVFLSCLWSDFDQTRTYRYVICLGL